MAHIETGNQLPGIVNLLWYKPKTAKALGVFAEQIIRGKSGLTIGERELIAAHVSYLNECRFCHDSHAAAATTALDDLDIVKDVIKDLESADLTPKMKALLKVAGKVQKGGRHVLPADIEAARKNGASDEDIHDTVIVAAAFCMFNRYVDGLGTTPAEPEEYEDMGKRLTKQGYKFPFFFPGWLVRFLLARSYAKTK